MAAGPLVTQQIDAGARFVGEFAKYTPLQAAFWLTATDDNEWFLYVAGEHINDSNFGVAYGEVVRIMSTMRDPWLEPLQVKVIGNNHPLAKDVVAIQRKHHGTTPVRYHGGQLGGLSVDEAYIYPLPIAVPS